MSVYRIEAGIAALLVLMTAGCLQTLEPLPPDEALQTAAREIDRILSEESAHPTMPAPLDVAETTPDPCSLSFWFFAHPLVSPAFGVPDRVKDFERAHPGTDLKALFIGEWGQAVQKLTVCMVAGDLPDVALVKRGWLAALVDSGRIIPLDFILPPSFLADLRPPYRDTLTIEGHLYALPADGFCSALFCNQALVKDDPPATWDELHDLARSLKAQNIGEGFYPIGDLPFLESLWGAGGTVCQGTRCTVAQTPGREALSFLLSLRDQELLHPLALGRPDATFDAFLRGKLAMTVTSSQFLARTPRASFPVSIGPVPGKSGPVSALSENIIVVFARHATAKAPAITALLDYMTGPDILGQAALVQGSLPVRTSVAQGLVLPEGLAAAQAHARAAPLHRSWNEMESILYRYLELAYRWQAEAGGDS